jgi:hypothetical protein
MLKCLVNRNIHLTFVKNLKTLIMKPRFFQAVLKEVEGDVLEHVYGKNHNMTITERMGNNEGTCPECGCNSWILLPKESSAVSQGGKPYIECMECGTSSHL